MKVRAVWNLDPFRDLSSADRQHLVRGHVSILMTDPVERISIRLANEFVELKLHLSVKMLYNIQGPGCESWHCVTGDGGRVC